MVQSITATFDGQALRPDWVVPLRPNQRYILTIRELPSVPENSSAWDVLHKLAGTVEAPDDWAAEHDHYLYGSPKKDDNA